jgi:hypothetical protein
MSDDKDTQGELFGLSPDPDHAFGGDTYDPQRDFVRLKGQLARTWNVMLDGRWRTLAQIAKETSAMRNDGGKDSEAAISARLRDFRKVKFGAHVLQAENIGGGLWHYRLLMEAGDVRSQSDPGGNGGGTSASAADARRDPSAQ